MQTAIIYGRVSLNRQDYERQVQDLQRYADVNEYKVVQVFTDNISGNSKTKNRKESKKMLDYLKHNEVSIVLVSEISRLGRSAMDVQNTINEIVYNHKVNLYIHQQGLVAYTKQGKLNTTFKLITDVLANVAEMELEQIRDRILSGLENARRKGITLGRPKGTTKNGEEILNQYPKVIKELRQKKPLSLRKIAKLCDVSVNTVQKVKKTLQNIKKQKLTK